MTYGVLFTTCQLCGTGVRLSSIASKYQKIFKQKSKFEKILGVRGDPEGLQKGVWKGIPEGVWKGIPEGVPKGGCGRGSGRRVGKVVTMGS